MYSKDDANRILLTLEDGFVVSTMEVSDRALEMGENWTNYILDELNHQVERSLLPPIEFSEVSFKSKDSFGDWCSWLKRIGDCRCAVPPFEKSMKVAMRVRFFRNWHRES